MVRNFRTGLLVALTVLAFGAAASAQERRSARIDVQHYDIDAEINPATQSLKAIVKMRFVPLEDNITSAVFELNNALGVSKVEDSQGRPVSGSRNQRDFTISLGFPQALQRGTPETVTFTYDGRLTEAEESPVYGIRFASIRSDYSYLMYPARWFPVNDYTADRYTADLKISVPAGFRVVSSGTETAGADANGRAVFSFRFTQPSFPGSVAVVQGEPNVVNSQGIRTSVHFRGENQQMAAAYGEEVGKIMTFFAGIYGLPPFANLSLVETERGTPNGYSAPGVLFLASSAIGSQPNTRLLANQLSRQWWGGLLSPENRNHIWLTNGFARYSELLYLEHVNGPSMMQAEMRDMYVEALTVAEPPLIQAGRLEDYSPEFWAATAGKGASVLNMLRHVMGDQKFQETVKAFPDQFAWKGVTTADFRSVAEKITGEDLRFFFIQWIESTGAPEFRLEYTVFRTQKGFRVMGKVSQDLDTFRMPVDLKIETEGNPEAQRVEVVGTSSEFVIETFGKPRQIFIDPDNFVLRYNDDVRVAVAIRRGEQFAEIGEFGEALREYQKALDVNRYSSLAHYRVAEVFFLQNNFQSAANEFREALNGDLEPQWTEVWSHINLGKIFDITGQRERAQNEYNLAIRTKDNTQGAQEEAAKYLKEPYRQRSRSEV